MIKAALNDYRQSPRKVRLVANLVKGKRVSEALMLLRYAPQEASHAITKLIESALANAKHNFSLDKEKLSIKDIQVNPGTVLKRIMPRARGSAAQILKRSSHISVILEEKALKVKRSKKLKTEKKTI
jgi:large subunit ribosomal protein L22